MFMCQKIAPGLQAVRYCSALWAAWDRRAGELLPANNGTGALVAQEDFC